MEDQVLATLRGQLADIILGIGFLFIASQMWGACSISAIRRQSGARLFIWLGIWSAIYGIGLLTQSRAVVAALPLSIQASVPYVTTGIGYLTLVVGLCAFLELVSGSRSLSVLLRVNFAATCSPYCAPLLVMDALGKMHIPWRKAAWKPYWVGCRVVNNSRLNSEAFH